MNNIDIAAFFNLLRAQPNITINNLSEQDIIKLDEYINNKINSINDSQNNTNNYITIDNNVFIIDNAVYINFTNNNISKYLLFDILTKIKDLDKVDKIYLDKKIEIIFENNAAYKSNLNRIHKIFSEYYKELPYIESSINQYIKDTKLSSLISRLYLLYNKILKIGKYVVGILLKALNKAQGLLKTFIKKLITIFKSNIIKSEQYNSIINYENEQSISIDLTRDANQNNEAVIYIRYNIEGDILAHDIINSLIAIQILTENGTLINKTVQVKSIDLVDAIYVPAKFIIENVTAVGLKSGISLEYKFDINTKTLFITFVKVHDFLKDVKTYFKNSFYFTTGVLLFVFLGLLIFGINPFQFLTIMYSANSVTQTLMPAFLYSIIAALLKLSMLGFAFSGVVLLLMRIPEVIRKMRLYFKLKEIERLEYALSNEIRKNDIEYYLLLSRQNLNRLNNQLLVEPANNNNNIDNNRSRNNRENRNNNRHKRQKRNNKNRQR